MSKDVILFLLDFLEDFVLQTRMLNVSWIKYTTNKKCNQIIDETRRIFKVLKRRARIIRYMVFYNSLPR